MNEAHDLALLLRAGALPRPSTSSRSARSVPSLGQDNIDQGFRSTVIGFVLVLIFMAVYYRVFGLVANLALTRICPDRGHHLHAAGRRSPCRASPASC